MSPDEPLSNWARLEVQKMIDETLGRYDEKQDRRHRENSEKLEFIQKAIQQANGAKLILLAVIPTILAILQIIGFFKGK